MVGVARRMSYNAGNRESMGASRVAREWVTRESIIVSTSSYFPLKSSVNGTRRSIGRYLNKEIYGLVP